jgi:hypothetical protein
MREADTSLLVLKKKMVNQFGQSRDLTLIALRRFSRR